LIAVTGATGFLGSHLVCMLLQKGLKVRAFKRATSSLAEFNYIYGLFFTSTEQQSNLQWVVADVLDIPSLELGFEGVEEVYHCAAMVSFSQKDAPKMHQINVQGTGNVVNVCLQLGIKKLAYISSIAALGREKGGVTVTEQTKWVTSGLNSNYALSKRKAEMEVWRAVEEGLKTVIVNPGVILGSGDWSKGTGALFGMVKKGMPFFTDGMNGYVDVKDVAEITIRLMESNQFNERFILVAENVTMKWFLDEVAVLLGKKKPFIKVNKLLAEMAWIGAAVKQLFTGKKPGLTKETSRASLKKYSYSNQKIVALLDYKFIPLRQTLINTCNNFNNKPFT
jgi:dihydroflavonol-4-reductase